MNRKQKKMRTRIVCALILMIVLAFVNVEGWLRFALYMIPYFVVGYDILKKAVLGIYNRQIFDENFLMAIATVGAITIAIAGEGDYTEAVAVMLFYQIGELFQSYAVGKSRRNISTLMDIRPDYANVEVNGELVKVSPEEVSIGSVIVVRPGEKVPIDGVVVEGESTLDTSALTGESVPRDITAGGEIISGCINMTGVLKMQTTREFGESTVSKILELVGSASSKKSRSEDFISKFAKVYTPIVCYSALALAVLPPVGRMLLMGLESAWMDWIYRALTFLVISCPCALVISIPLSFFAGIGAASKEGVLIKGSNYLEALSKVDTMVFDKTGTLTKGVFEVDAIYPCGMTGEELLDCVAHTESASSHPISQSLQRAYGQSLNLERVSEIKEIGGYGVEAKVDGKRIAVGNEKWMQLQREESRKTQCNGEDEGLKEGSLTLIGRDTWEVYEENVKAFIGTVIYVAVDGMYAGCIVIADVVKADSQQAIRALKKAGVKHTVMLTGDAKEVANQVAEKLRLDSFFAELLPHDKVEQVEKLLEGKPDKEKLAFVGDGINDAPVLSRADIGIAMGAMGSDAAIEAADVVLMDDSPMKIVKAIRISRKCMGIVYQNIIFSIGVKVVCLLLGAFGIANMWLAIFADVGVMVLAVCNAIRVLFTKNL